MSIIGQAVMETECYRSGRDFTIKDIERETRLERAVVRGAMNALQNKNFVVCFPQPQKFNLYRRPQVHWIHQTKIRQSPVKSFGERMWR